MADQQSDSDNKPSFTLRAGLAACVSSIIIGVSSKVYAEAADKGTLQTVLLIAPFLGQLTSAVISIPIQFGLDAIDLYRHKNNVENLLSERANELTTEERKKGIDTELEFFRSEIFKLRSKSIVR